MLVIANMCCAVFYDFFFLFLVISRLFVLYSSSNSPTHHQPSEWLSELGLASSLSVVKMDHIRRDEEWERRYRWEPEYWEVKHRLKRICKNVHIKPGVHLIAQSFCNFTLNGGKTDRLLWYLTLNICLPLVLFVSNWPSLSCKRNLLV